MIFNSIYSTLFMWFFSIAAPSSASTGISPSTATAVVPYSAPEATAEAQSLVPTTQVQGTLVLVSRADIFRDVSHPLRMHKTTQL